jgi:hypothetical protein
VPEQSIYTERTEHSAAHDFLEMLPVRYRQYVRSPLRSTEGNRTALEGADDLEPGESLYLYGSPENGKTHLAVTTGFRLLEFGGVAFWNMARLYAHLRDCGE